MSCSSKGSCLLHRLRILPSPVHHNTYRPLASSSRLQLRDLPLFSLFAAALMLLHLLLILLLLIKPLGLVDVAIAVAIDVVISIATAVTIVVAAVAVVVAIVIAIAVVVDDAIDVAIDVTVAVAIDVAVAIVAATIASIGKIFAMLPTAKSFFEWEFHVVRSLITSEPSQSNFDRPLAVVATTFEEDSVITIAVKL